jgi:hypothetical protein
MSKFEYLDVKASGYVALSKAGNSTRFCSPDR